MLWRTPILSPSCLRSLLQILATAKSLPQIAQLHQHLAAAGLIRDPSVVTKLLQLYADAGDLSSALQLFAILPSPSVFAWTPILALLSRSANHTRCLASYRSMRSFSIAPDGYVFPVVLRSAAADHDQHISALHADAIKFAAAAAIPVANALIVAYSKSGDLAAARRTFDLAGCRDLLSWNSIIAAYSSADRVDTALGLLDSMRSNGCDPDLVTWNTVMDGYCRAGRCSEARDILFGLAGPNTISWTAVISGYSRSGNHEAALELFSRMMFAGSVPPDLDTLSCMVASCRQATSVVAGSAVHAYGLRIFPVDAFYRSAGAALILLYASVGRISTARSVFEMMDPTDVVTWNAMIQGLARARLEGATLAQFREMVSRGIQANHISLSTVALFCNLKLGKELHAHVMKHDAGCGCTVTGMNALIEMYSRSGCIKAAHQIFSSMDAKDVVTWNTIIGAYGSHGQGKLAVKLVNQMMRNGFKPNQVTFTSTLMACAHCGLVDEGLQFFEALIREVGFVATQEHYACVVDMLARAGRFKEAVAFVASTPAAAGSNAWGAILSACQIQHDVQFGRAAFEQLVRLEPDNPGNYVTMSSMYMSAGKWQEAEEVRLMMERGPALLKPSGQSWIDAT